MSHNRFGKLLTVTTFGESHGPEIGCVIDGFPPGFPVNLDMIQNELKRRATGRSRHTSQRKEADCVRLISGVFEGKTTGTPIAMLIVNTDARSRDYANIKDQVRPGHADYTYWKKYGLRDYRGGGRSSARETTMRVAAGALAKDWLQANFGITIAGWLGQVGECVFHTEFNGTVNNHPLFLADEADMPRLESYLDALRKSGDSVGARVHVRARGVPAGWGEPVYGKLDADIAAAMMSINATKGVEIGAGFASVAHKGSEHRDVIENGAFQSNHAGGILGGISSGQDITASVAFKPTSSLRLPAPSVDQCGQPVQVVTKGRHDPCVGIRAVPIVEAMMALTLMDHALRHRGQCGEKPLHPLVIE